MKRSCGILLPISSLPSPYGIGTLGKAAYNFIDFLKAAGQAWWQILPVGPTSYGDSPYQSFSTFAGNPYFIDLEMLIEEGLLSFADLDGVDFGSDNEKVDYGKLYENRFAVLKKAYKNGIEKGSCELQKFIESNTWLPDYALFMALKYYFDMKPWYAWADTDIRLHKPEAIKKYSALLREDVEFFEYIQYLFFKQWDKMREYAKENGIGIIGDMPIYVAMDSADVWSNPDCFMLDEENIPLAVAGVPPDYFCEDGQLWGNPLYDYEKMRLDGYGWWIRRVDGAAKMFDVLRIDHFRGFESFWAVPYGEKTAKNGKWIKGPAMDLVGRLTSWFNNVSFIAEDLGILTPEVHKLIDDSMLPRMKVLEFAFEPSAYSDYLPHNHITNCICYTGTHDNAPLMQWLCEAEAEEIEFAEKYLGVKGKDNLFEAIIRAGMQSTANVFIAQMQDYLKLGSSSRTNIPGTDSGNWQWRLSPDAIPDELAKSLYDSAKIYGRLNEERAKIHN